MERMCYREWELTLKTFDYSSKAADFTKETKALIRIGLGTRFYDMEKFRIQFNRVIRAAMKSFTNGTFYSCVLSCFVPYENESGEYAGADFQEWRLSVSHAAASEIVFDGCCRTDNITLDAKNPFRSFAENF